MKLSSNTCVSALLYGIFLCVLLVPGISFAQTTSAATPVSATSSTTASSTAATNTFIPLTQLPQITSLANTNSFPIFFNSLYKICIGLAAVIAVLQIMRAGAIMMVQQGSALKNEQARTLIQNSIFGLVLVLSPTIVFGIINPDILKLNLNVSGLQPTSLSQVNTAAPATTGTSCTAGAKAVVGTGSGVCSSVGAGYTVGAGTCCGGVAQGSSCCVAPNTVAPQKYLLAYYYIKTTTSPKNTCYVEQVSFYDTIDACTLQKNNALATRGVAQGNSTLSKNTFVKSCEATTLTTYAIPVPNNLAVCVP